MYSEGPESRRYQESVPCKDRHVVVREAADIRDLVVRGASCAVDTLLIPGICESIPLDEVSEFGGVHLTTPRCRDFDAGMWQTLIKKMRLARREHEVGSDMIDRAKDTAFGRRLPFNDDRILDLSDRARAGFGARVWLSERRIG